MGSEVLAALRVVSRAFRMLCAVVKAGCGRALSCFARRPAESAA
jgi:hypothetical protein